MKSVKFSPGVHERAVHLVLRPGASSNRSRRPSSPHQIASSGYRRDRAKLPHIERVWNANLQIYCATKVWRQLDRDGHAVVRCTAALLVHRRGLELALNACRSERDSSLVSHSDHGAGSTRSARASAWPTESNPL